MNMEPVRIETIANGAIGEMFEQELRRVLEDIDNPNTKAEKIRTITVTVAIQPTESRDAASVMVQVKSKLSGLRPAGGVIHMHNQKGKLVALAQSPNQQDAFLTIHGKKESE